MLLYPTKAGNFDVVWSIVMKLEYVQLIVCVFNYFLFYLGFDLIFY